MDNPSKKDTEKLTPLEFREPPEERPDWRTYECNNKKFHLVSDLDNDPRIRKEQEGNI